MRSLLLLLLMLTCSGQIHAQCEMDFLQHYNFRYLSVNNGLSQNSITSVIQDKKGFIWIGTYDGLNRFDGFSVQTRRHISNNKNSLSDNRILSLFETSEGQILIGTDGGGINVFNPRLDTMLHIATSQGKIQRNIIQALTKDRSGKIWAGTPQGLVIIKNNKDLLFPAVMKNHNIKTILKDHNGNIWVGTSVGLYVFKDGKPEALKLITATGQKEITALYQDRKNSIWIGAENQLFSLKGMGEVNQLYCYPLPDKVLITAVTQDFNGDLWVSSKRNGIFRMKLNVDLTVSTVSSYSTEKPFCNLAENSINTMFIDRSNTLWVGSYQKGINYADLTPKNFQTFFPLLKNHEGVFGYQGKYISAVSETKNDLWVGTFNEGLYVFNKCTKSTQSYSNVFGSTSICAIQQSADGTVYIGGNDGLYVVAKNDVGERKQIKKIRTGFIARSISEDRFGNLWIASYNGIYKYNPRGQKFSVITEQNGLTTNAVYVVYQDPYAQLIWAGTIGGGLLSISYDKNGPGKITQYSHQENHAKSISSNHVWSIYRDKRNTLWIGTDAGLNELKLNALSQIISFNAVNSPLLRDQKIMAILEDDFANLWLSSSQGLFKFKIVNKTEKRFTHQDGLQSNTLTEAAYKNERGLMYFGGINGLNYFIPDKVKNNPFDPSVAFTELRISNHPFRIGEKIGGHTILENDINYTQQIILPYDHKDFSIAFSSLHFVAPENNKYRYKLEGYDKGWITTGADQRSAAYSNLDAGSYTFLLTSSNNDEAFPEAVKRIKFIIEPAPWATWWAKVFYLIFCITGIMLIINYLISRNRLKNEIYKEKLEKEKVKELNEIKLNFFTNITHEIRTPLNLILSPLKDLIDVENVYDHFTTVRLKIIHRNSLKLHALINQILDLRKISSDSDKLSLQESDLIPAILNIKEAFEWHAGQSNIRFDFHAPKNIYGWFDRDKIEKVVFNLLSNAFKYTPKDGRIKLSIDKKLNLVYIIVEDSGLGVHEKDREHIFEMYYQSEAHSNSGTGIGLALSKKLIEMHQGEILLESSTLHGSAFTIIFPIDKESYAVEYLSTELMEMEETVMVEPRETLAVSKTHQEKKTILIVEDNEDQRIYLRESLLQQFHILEAGNGAEGLESAKRNSPDLIITDLMMPCLDGTEFCKRIKSNIKTSHIPVIVHSVNNSSLSIKNALLAGADDFIAKPYDYAMLTLKVNNILNSKNQLALSFHREELSKPSNIEVPSLDKELLAKIMNYVEQNMADNNLSVEKLCDHIGMSRMNLHRRLHAVIGKTTSEFIREVRLKRAGQLLGSGSKRITEVMFEIGISSNAHFNKYFKDMYGLSPKEYIKKVSKEPNI